MNLAGINYVGLGPDFTYYIPGYDHFEFAGGIKDYSGMYLILNELERRGYSDPEIRKIVGRNFARVYKKTIL